MTSRIKLYGVFSGPGPRGTDLFVFSVRREGLRVGNSREGARSGVEVRAMRGLIAGSAFRAKSSQAGVPVLLKANQLGCAAWSMALGLHPSQLYNSG